MDAFANFAPDWPLGSLVEKISGSQWRGKIVGYYSTRLTPCGIAVESHAHLGSVQIYPTKAMRIVVGVFNDTQDKPVDLIEVKL